MKNKNTLRKTTPLEFIQNNSVPILFVLICAACIPASGFSASYLLNEVVTRMGRNIFLVMGLLIPIMAGMGLNFAMGTAHKTASSASSDVQP